MIDDDGETQTHILANVSEAVDTVVVVVGVVVAVVTGVSDLERKREKKKLG